MARFVERDDDLEEIEGLGTEVVIGRGVLATVGV